MYEKEMVYVLSVIFTEESGLEGSEEYYAKTQEDIPRIREKIYDDYREGEIEDIIVSDEPEERTFYKWEK